MRFSNNFSFHYKREMVWSGIGLAILVGLVILFTLLGTLLWGKKNPDGMFLACGPNDAQVGWSETGETWTASTHAEGGLPFGSGGLCNELRHANGLWLAGGLSSGDRTRQIVWSNDGKTFNDTSGTQPGDHSSAQIRRIRYGNGKWVAGGTSETTTDPILFYSDDGKSWSTAEGNPFGTIADRTCNNVTYINNKWIASGDGGTAGGSVKKIWTSDDGVTWTAVSSTPFGTTAGVTPGMLAYGNDVYVACGGAPGAGVGSLWFSSDADTWTEATTNPFGDNIDTLAVGFYNGIFVAVGRFQTDGTVVAWSTDGDTWTAGTGLGTLSGTNFLDTLIIPNKSTGLWFAGGGTNSTVGSGNGFGFTSPDGKAWTAVDETFFTGGDIQDVIGGWSGRVNDSTQRTVAVGITDGDSNIYFSDDRKNWTAATPTTVFGNATSDQIVEVRYG